MDFYKCVSNDLDVLMRLKTINVTFCVVTILFFLFFCIGRKKLVLFICMWNFIGSCSSMMVYKKRRRRTLRHWFERFIKTSHPNKVH